MPHGTASSKLIEAGELVTLDFGALVDGYRSDMTRTVAVGEVDERARTVYQAVLEAEETALQAVRAGADGKALDALAREVLARHALAEHFTHGLGHGVGLEIHENPSLSFRASFILQAGMTATIEPGVYLPGEIGARIEDLVIVAEGGCELLTHSPKHLIELES
jgi:Xaa-Pro aminopeptidase